MYAKVFDFKACASVKSSAASVLNPRREAAVANGCSVQSEALKSHCHTVRKHRRHAQQ